MAIKIGINGFGRIGRNVFRIGLKDPDIDFVGVNDITDSKTLAHLLKYDSVHGVLDADVRATGDAITVDNENFRVTALRDPKDIPWKDMGADIVVESTGLFRTHDQASLHLKGGAKKVVISAPSKDPDFTVVMGVNDKDYIPDKHHIVSNASCTTNCLAPVAKVLHENFSIEKGWMTTIHAYTNDQRILDLPHKDLRRARAAALSMIPTTTGAAAAVALVLPELKGKLDGLSIRVPTPNVSLVDLVALLKKETSAEDVIAALKKAAAGDLQNYLHVEEGNLVSIDFNGSGYSSIVDAPFLKMIDNNMVKVLAWYDNEWGYSCRTIDLIKYMASSL